MMSSRLLRVSKRIYKTLLVLYPKEFRDNYGPHMTQAFGDKYREVIERAGTLGLVALWTRTILDLFFTALAERRRVSVATSRIERLRYATDWFFRDWRWRKLSRSRMRMVTVSYAVLLISNVILSYVNQRQDSLSETFAVQVSMAIMFLGLICLATGELFYARSKTLAGLLWLVGLFVFLPLATVLIVAVFWSGGTTFGTTLTILYSGGLLFVYGVFAWRYLLADSSNAQQRR